MRGGMSQRAQSAIGIALLLLVFGVLAVRALFS